MKEGGPLNTLLLLPLKFIPGCRGPFAVGGFSAGKLFQSGDIAASTGASGKTNCRKWTEYVGCGAGDDAGGGADVNDVIVFGVGASVIRLSKRNLIWGSDEWYNNSYARIVLIFISVQCSKVQYSTVRYTVQYGAIRCRAISVILGIITSRDIL